MSSFVPYRDMAPKTTDLRVLRENLRAMRERFGRGSSHAGEAFQHLCREAGRQGEPLDGLRRHTKDEVERFFAFTIPGLDGHVYWDGPVRFRRNDGAVRIPKRWWWEREHGPLGHGDTVLPTCGERNCINPEHQVKQDRVARHLLFTETQIIGAIQVAALRLGRTPRINEWDSLGIRPSRTVIFQRFGTWDNAMRQAGLSYHSRFVTPAKCIAALRFGKRFLGHWPSVREFRSRTDLKAALKAEGLVSSENAIYRHLDRAWEGALRKAGKR